MDSSRDKLAYSLCGQTIAQELSQLFPLAYIEALDAAPNLLAFVELLTEIDQEHGITRHSADEATR